MRIVHIERLNLIEPSHKQDTYVRITTIIKDILDNPTPAPAPGAEESFTS